MAVLRDWITCVVRPTGGAREMNVYFGYSLQLCYTTTRAKQSYNKLHSSLRRLLARAIHYFSSYSLPQLHLMVFFVVCVCYGQRVGESGSSFAVGADLTIGDLVVYFLVKMIRDDMFDYVPSDYVDAWPSITGLEKAVPEHPLVKAYYEKYPVTA